MSDSRERFEAWAKDVPREWEVDIHNGEGAWPGQYTEYHVQCAWEGWQAAEAQAVRRCAEIVDDTRLWAVAWEQKYGKRTIAEVIRAKFPEAFN
jgi:hypothetical protein